MRDAYRHGQRLVWAEKVLDAICELFPGAPLTTLVRVPGSVSARIEARPIRTSFVQALPAPARFYRQRFEKVGFTALGSHLWLAPGLSDRLVALERPA